MNGLQHELTKAKESRILDAELYPHGNPNQAAKHFSNYFWLRLSTFSALKELSSSKLGRAGREGTIGAIKAFGKLQHPVRAAKETLPYQAIKAHSSVKHLIMATNGPKLRVVVGCAHRNFICRQFNQSINAVLLQGGQKRHTSSGWLQPITVGSH